MLRYLVTAAIALMASSAMAQQRSGWSSYEDVSNAGIPVCGITATGTPETEIHIKYFQGGSHLIVHLFRVGWAYLPITTLETRLTVDGQQVWTGTSGARMDHTQISIDATDVERVVEAISRGRSLSVDVTDQTTMTIPLRGSDRAVSQMIRCIARIQAPAPRRHHT